MSPAGATEYCEERSQLVAAWIRAAAALSEKASLLQAVSGTSRHAEFQVLLAEVEAARIEVEKARLAAIFHKEEHGC